MFKQNFLYFSLSPLSFLPSLCTTEKSLTTSSLHPPFRYLYTSLRSPEPPRLQAERSQLSILLLGQIFQSPTHPHVRPLDWLHYVHISHVWGSPALAPEHQMRLSSAEQEGRIPSPACWQHTAQCSPGSCWLTLPPGLINGSHLCCFLSLFSSLSYCSVNVAHSSVLITWILLIWELPHTSENSSH